MELLNKVKDELKAKGYDIESFTDYELRLIYDCVYSTEELLISKNG